MSISRSITNHELTKAKCVNDKTTKFFIIIQHKNKNVYIPYKNTKIFMLIKNLRFNQS